MNVVRNVNIDSSHLSSSNISSKNDNMNSYVENRLGIIANAL